jgi:hypothetical protein
MVFRPLHSFSSVGTLRLFENVSGRSTLQVTQIRTYGKRKEIVVHFNRTRLLIIIVARETKMSRSRLPIIFLPEDVMLMRENI